MMFVQSNDGWFYQNPRWNSENAVVSGVTLFVVAVSVGRGRRIGNSFLKKRQIFGKIGDLSLDRAIFPGSVAMVDCWSGPLTLSEAPATPDEWDGKVSSVSVEDFDWAWSYPFPADMVRSALDGGEIDVFLASFVMGERIFKMDVDKFARKVRNRLRKQFPDGLIDQGDVDVVRV